MTIGVCMSDFRELEVWKRARLLAFVGHDLASRLQGNPVAMGYAEALRNRCVDLLTAIVNRYEGEGSLFHQGEPEPTDRILEELEALIAKSTDQGAIHHSDYIAMHKEIAGVKALL